MAKSGSSRRREAAAKRARKRRQRAGLVFGIGGLALVAVAALILLSQGQAASAVDVGNVGDYSNYPQGVDETGAPYIGEENAPVTLVEYSDFGCPACNAFSETVHQLIDTYVADGTLRITYKPLSFVAQTSPTAAAAGVCAADQGMFWEMHDAMFNLLSTQGPSAFAPKTLTDVAAELGLNDDAFGDCLSDGGTRDTVLAFMAEAQGLGVGSTPTVMFNGQLLEAGAVPLNVLEGMIQAAS
jgi:protein-disulfide isomerase